MRRNAFWTGSLLCVMEVIVLVSGIGPPRARLKFEEKLIKLRASNPVYQ